ncbi:hypothetical protein A9Q84_15415 [Halobacteriovorax marinus]|uniref:Uncharacterized protein n=1 Tax=Halobacteriovorax marinus TaxID=97084 RepID=A0A1Y5F982_9BACT|nr:hypothetical protein A9Q84_15415 [Halobacteriovorax marinus]
MKIPDLYNDLELKRYLDVQQKFAWDLEADFNWAGGVDLSKPLVPLSKNNKLFEGFASEQKLVISQMLGLIVNEAFNEFEISLDKFKKQCWEDILLKNPVNPEMWDLGVEFFEDEHKHSLAFNRYTDIFAKSVDVEAEELKQILPSMENNKLAKLFNVNAMAGGAAIWWLAAAVEEESMMLYQYIRNFKGEIDPLYHQLHKNHFEEEARHASYAFLMLELIEKRSKTPVDVLMQKIDFILSDVFQITWTFTELSKVRKVKHLTQKNEFFKILASTIPLMREKGPIEIIHSLFTDTPYISMILNPKENRNIKDAIEKFRPWALPKFKPQGHDLTCEF